MTRLEDRQTLMDHIEQACAAGARLAPACALAGIDARTLQRWQAGDGLTTGDRRPTAHRPVPSHALSEAERARIIEVANEPRFAETPPARIVPTLADEGIYIASEFQLPSRAARAWPDEPPRARPSTARVRATDHAHRHPSRRGLVLGDGERDGGCDVPANTPSIQSVTLLFGRQHRKSSFPVRSTNLISRPDRATPKPRRATQEMGGAEPPRATHRAPWRASMARMASIRPSSQ